MSVSMNLEMFTSGGGRQTEWLYSAVHESLSHPDVGRYHSYGVQVAGFGHAAVLHDVSIYKRTVEVMVELFNHHQLSPIHLHDAVMDLCECG